MVTKNELKESLKSLGVCKGMTLEVHSSLSSFGELEGGAETVIDTLKELVTEEGSVFMPALRQNGYGDRGRYIPQTAGYLYRVRHDQHFRLGKIWKRGCK